MNRFGGTTNKIMNKVIKDEQEFQDFCTDIRNRQYEVNSIKVNISEIIDENILRYSPTSSFRYDLG